MAGLIQECMSSGLKVKVMVQNNISKIPYYWLKKLREAACHSIEANVVRVPEQYIPHSFTPSFSPELTISIGSITININSATPQHLIETTIQAVANVK